MGLAPYRFRGILNAENKKSSEVELNPAFMASATNANYAFAY
ncbi:hypothetical protein UPA1_G0203 [Ureaplasma parvum serovar 1 str. ATCC 27813]|nr:hypothetical protein UPA1_G0203 [Ureaplasma parvum serovar 1 str. ATCC 27813]